MDLQSSLKSYDNSLKKQETQYSGILGLTIDGSRKVNIPSRAGFVYVRLRDNLSEVVQAYNDKVSPAYGLPVIIQRTGNRWMVVGKDTNRYETWGTSAPFLPAHGSQHSFNRDVGVGGDTVWVYPDQFMPLLVYPSGTAGSTNLMVAPYLLKRDTDFIYAGNTGTQNLVMYKPADSQAILGLVVLNIDTGNPEILIASGTPISASLTGTSAIAPYIPYPASHQEPLYVFRLVSGTSYLTWDNLYNARQFIGGSSATSTGTSGGGNPAGNDRDVQFNNAGAFGADDQFIYQSDVKSLGLGDYDLMPYDTTKLIWNVGDNVSPGIFGLAYGSTRAPYLGFAKADGTGTAPTNVKANQAIGRIRGYGYDGASWSGVQAEITIVASANWVTGSYLPTRFDFDVTPSGSATKRTQFQIHGNSVNIPTGSTYNIGGIPHTHSASDIVTGTMETARLGSGTADSTTFLRGDRTWATPAGGSSDGWIAYSAVVPTRTVADDPTYTLQFAGVDLRTTLYEGMPIKWTQNSIIRYGWISSAPSYAASNTSITVLTRLDSTSTDYDVLDTATYTISNFNYGLPKQPGSDFPIASAKWRGVFTDTTIRSQATPTIATWYNLGGLSIAIPIGEWKVRCKVFLHAQENGADAGIYFTLSTANNSESDANFTMTARNTGATSADFRAMLTINVTSELHLTSKTTYYTNAKYMDGSVDILYFRNEVNTMKITYECAYL